MWLELGCRTAPLFLEGRQRPDPISLECHGKGRGALKQEPEAPPPSSPQSLLLRAPVLVFWERKSAEKPQGPTCKGLMGKEVRQV